jgi:hypothetical protein
MKELFELGLGVVMAIEKSKLTQILDLQIPNLCSARSDLHSVRGVRTLFQKEKK